MYDIKKIFLQHWPYYANLRFQDPETQECCLSNTAICVEKQYFHMPAFLSNQALVIWWYTIQFMWYVPLKRRSNKQFTVFRIQDTSYSCSFCAQISITLIGSKRTASTQNTDFTFWHEMYYWESLTVFSTSNHNIKLIEIFSYYFIL